MYWNNNFLFFKIYFYYQHIKKFKSIKKLILKKKLCTKTYLSHWFVEIGHELIASFLRCRLPLLLGQQRTALYVHISFSRLQRRGAEHIWGKGLIYRSVGRGSLPCAHSLSPFGISKRRCWSAERLIEDHCRVVELK